MRCRQWGLFAKQSSSLQGTGVSPGKETTGAEETLVTLLAGLGTGLTAKMTPPPTRDGPERLGGGWLPLGGKQVWPSRWP